MKMSRFDYFLQEFRRDIPDYDDHILFGLLPEDNFDQDGTGILLPFMGMGVTIEEGRKLLCIKLPSIKTIEKTIRDYNQLKDLKRHENSKPN